MPDDQTRGIRDVDHVAFIGLGLIASSMCLALRRAGFAGRITGHARTEATRVRAIELGLIDEAHATAADAVEGAEIVVLCVPVGACGAVASEIAGSLAEGAVVTDVGSVKAHVIEAVEPHLPAHARLAAGHPIAGTEKSGPDAGFSSLFDGRWSIITPSARSDAASVALVRSLWEALGSRVEIMTPDHHDRVLAITSHLPHLIAFNMVNAAADLGKVTNSDVIEFSAGGFRDFTRIAASDPIMWRDVFLNNKSATLEMLGRFSEELDALQQAIRDGDGELLEARFAAARAVRASIIDAGQDIAADDFGRALLATGAANRDDLSAPVPDAHEAGD
ncbi:MAG: prephenate/arogenate dehydrogenase family protein [Pseudomonadota bacterium]